MRDLETGSQRGWEIIVPFEGITCGPSNSPPLKVLPPQKSKSSTHEPLWGVLKPHPNCRRKLVNRGQKSQTVFRLIESHGSGCIYI
jgi:hypothetical protein